MIPVRYRSGDRVVRTFTLDGDHWLNGIPCLACGKRLVEGAELALVYIGPGSDREAQEKYIHGYAHTGAAVAIHKRCAGVMT